MYHTPPGKNGGNYTMARREKEFSMKKVSWFLVAMTLLAVIGVPNLAAQNAVLTSAIDAADGIFDGFDAVPTLSTESRYSAGVFGSYVDDFISVNDYDPEIGTFLFLGGFPIADGGTVETTETVVNLFGSRYALSAGFAKSFSRFYLGIYFGGNIVDAHGADSQGDITFSGDTKKASWATATWNANLAVLFGNATIGGIRLDLIMDDVTDTTTNWDGKIIGDGNGNGDYGDGAGTGVALAVSWGRPIALRGKELPIHAKLGYRFPDYVLTYPGAGDKQEDYSNAALLINAGAAYDLNDISTVEADLYLGGTFGSWRVGVLNGTTQGDFGAKLEVALANSFSPVTGVEIGLNPNLGIGFLNHDPNVTGDGSVDAYADTSFEIALGVDAGIKARLPGKFNKFTVITGAGLDIVDWQVTGVSGGDPSVKGNSQWAVTGIGWNPDTLTAVGSLGIGMVFDPNNNLSIGFGLSSLLDSLVEVDLPQMQIRAGRGLTAGGGHNLFGNLFNGAQIDLTVSYQF
jgi:hypothetical protein